MAGWLAIFGTEKKNFYATFAKFTTLVTLCKWCNERADIVIRFDLGVQFAGGPPRVRGGQEEVLTFYLSWRFASDQDQLLYGHLRKMRDFTQLLVPSLDNRWR